MTIYYCVDKKNKEILSVGKMPETWKNITGMSNLTGEAAYDLSWAGYENFGFLTKDELLNFGFTQELLNDSSRADTARQSALVKTERNKLLAASDWSQLPDANISEEKVLKWREYRQALRDLPNQPGFPWDIVIPGRP